jgi:hypothetical protein
MRFDGLCYVGYVNCRAGAVANDPVLALRAWQLLQAGHHFLPPAPLQQSKRKAPARDALLFKRCGARSDVTASLQLPDTLQRFSELAAEVFTFSCKQD